MLTEANLEAHSFRLDFAKELLGSFFKARAMTSMESRALLTTALLEDVDKHLQQKREENLALTMEITGLKFNAQAEEMKFKISLGIKDSQIAKLVEDVVNAERTVKRLEMTIVKLKEIGAEESEPIKRRRITADEMRDDLDTMKTRDLRLQDETIRKHEATIAGLNQKVSDLVRALDAERI